VWTATDACGNTATCNQTITVGLAAMKISQVYGAGGNVSGTVLADYIELYNAGVVPQVLTGWSIQFASTAGTAWTTSNFLAGATVNPGQYFLVRCALSAATGQAPNLPTPDHTTTFALSATDAKIALCNTTTALTGATPTSATIVDFIGFGTASQREPLVGGTTANNAVRPDASVATFRLNGGAQDTNNNFADFAQGYPAPRNTATALNNGLSPMGAALPTYGEEGNTIRLHATVMNNATSSAVLGATVTVNLTSLGGDPHLKGVGGEIMLEALQGGRVIGLDPLHLELSCTQDLDHLIGVAVAQGLRQGADLGAVPVCGAQRCDRAGVYAVQASHQIRQHRTRLDRRQLVGVTDEDDVSVMA